MPDAQEPQSEHPQVAEDSIWSVGELNAEIGLVLTRARDQLPSYVVGEVSDINRYGFGTFFDLRDLESDDTISCILWAHQRDAVSHELSEGTETIVRATVDFYEEDGRTQLAVKTFWPVGDSTRTENLAALRSQLESEGAFDDAAKQPLPEFPKHIGVVTSLVGSAREDFCEAVHNRHPGVSITVCDATVQGDDAPTSIVTGIQRLDQDPSIDIVVVTRGGGADADLWCFNTEPVVRAVADCNTPTIVAVGHDDDNTLAEAVADQPAMTPTDAGVAAVPDVGVVLDRLAQTETRLEQAYQDFVTGELTAMTQRLDAGFDTLQHRIQARETIQQRVANVEDRIAAAYKSLVETQLTTIETRLDQAEQAAIHAAETEAVTAKAARNQVRGLETRIDTAYQARVDRRIDTLESRITDAYREVETNARVEAGRSEAHRLKIALVVLLVVLGLLLITFAITVF